MKRTVRVLLLGESDAGLDYLRKFSESRGCLCCFAKSPAEAFQTYGPSCFDLVLNTLPDSMHQSLAGLGSSSCDIFCSYPVENGCWWLPLVSGGVKCLGAPAYRPKDFTGVLEETLNKREVLKAVAAGA